MDEIKSKEDKVPTEEEVTETLLKGAVEKGELVESSEDVKKDVEIELEKKKMSKGKITLIILVLVALGYWGYKFFF